MNGDVTVREVIARNYLGVSESDGLLETAELLLEEGDGSAVVLRGREPVGLVTDRDVLEYVVGGGVPDDATVADVMQERVPTVHPDSAVSEAADRMSARATRRLLVTNGEEPIGLLTEHDVLTTTTLSQDVTEEPAGEPVATEQEAGASEGYSNQGICEVCGSLSRELSTFNGQLVCSDCKNV